MNKTTRNKMRAVCYTGTMTSSDEAIAEMAKVANVREKLPEWQAAAVLNARKAGMTWTMIAQHLGVTVRAAQQWAEWKR